MTSSEPAQEKAMPTAIPPLAEDGISKIQELHMVLDNIVNDATKFFRNGNKAAGVRTRKSLQDLKLLAQELRVAIQKYKSAREEEQQLISRNRNQKSKKEESLMNNEMTTTMELTESISLFIENDDDTNHERSLIASTPLPPPPTSNQHIRHWSTEPPQTHPPSSAHHQATYDQLFSHHQSHPNNMDSSLNDQKHQASSSTAIQIMPVLHQNQNQVSNLSKQSISPPPGYPLFTEDFQSNRND